MISTKTTWLREDNMITQGSSMHTWKKGVGVKRIGAGGDGKGEGLDGEGEGLGDEGN